MHAGMVLGGQRGAGGAGGHADISVTMTCKEGSGAGQPKNLGERLLTTNGFSSCVCATSHHHHYHHHHACVVLVHEYSVMGKVVQSDRMPRSATDRGWPSGVNASTAHLPPTTHISSSSACQGRGPSAMIQHASQTHRCPSISLCPCHLSLLNHRAPTTTSPPTATPGCPLTLPHTHTTSQKSHPARDSPDQGAATAAAAHLLFTSLSACACVEGRTMLCVLNTRRMWASVMASGSSLDAPALGLTAPERTASASGGVCARHCSTLFMKQVFPRFCSPAPCGGGWRGGPSRGRDMLARREGTADPHRPSAQQLPPPTARVGWLHRSCTASSRNSCSRRESRSPAAAVGRAPPPPPRPADAGDFSCCCCWWCCPTASARAGMWRWWLLQALLSAGVACGRERGVWGWARLRGVRARKRSAHAPAGARASAQARHARCGIRHAGTRWGLGRHACACVRACARACMPRCAAQHHREPALPHLAGRVQVEVERAVQLLSRLLRAVALRGNKGDGPEGCLG